MQEYTGPDALPPVPTKGEPKFPTPGTFGPMPGNRLQLGTLSIHGDRAALFASLARAQANYQPIPRSRQVKVRSDKGDYTFDYAPLEEVISATLPALNAEGIAWLSVRADGEPGAADLHSMLTHESGAFLHVVERLPTVAVGKDGAEYPMRIQDFGSLLTYRRRYQYQCLTGTSPEFDDDGNQADGNRVEAMAQKPRRTPPAPPQKAAAPAKAPEPHPHTPPAQEAATREMSPEQKATFTGPTVFNAKSEPPPARVTEPEALTEEDVLEIREAFKKRQMGGPQATEFVRTVTGKARDQVNRADKAKILAALEAL